MARIKQTVMQRDFSFMGVREDFLEGDDLELRRASLKSATNMRSLATRAIEQRPGTFFKRTIAGSFPIIEIRDQMGNKYGLRTKIKGFEILDEEGDILFEELTAAPWALNEVTWIESFLEYTLLGNEYGIYKLTKDAGAETWTAVDFEFDAGPGGELQQPYWVFDKNFSIKPSDISGNITVTSNANLWTDNHVGLRIRYNRREILITNRLTPRVVEGTVINQLPPSFQVSVQDSTEFRVGDSVNGADTNFQGIVIAINGVDLDISTLAFFEGPDVDEELNGPNGSSKVTAKATIPPVYSPVWDEPLMSDYRGYPRAASAASGRLMLLDMPEAQDVIAVSSARSLGDFKVGADDDDGIARSVGDNSPRWMHAVNMGDILLFSSRGTYIVPTRDNGILTPSTFNVVLVDETASSDIRPVRVEDGVVFIEAGGETICAALLDGNVYLKWSVRELSAYHSHLINSPTSLCGPALGSTSAEKYLFVVNGDGTLAVLSWKESIRDERIGFVLWETQGAFQRVIPIFGKYWAIVSRLAPPVATIYLEEVSNAAFLDCAIESEDGSQDETLTVNGDTLQFNGEDVTVDRPFPTHLQNTDVTIYSNGWDAGEVFFYIGGSTDPLPEFTGSRQMGLNFECEIEPWPTEIIESPRVGTLTARVLQMIVSVQNTLGFDVTCNAYSAKIGAYLAGDDLSAPPVPRTRLYRFSVFGNRDHPSLAIRRPRPGPFRVLAIGQRVQG